MFQINDASNNVAGGRRAIRLKQEKKRPNVAPNAQTYLVTGGTGSLGRALVGLLEAEGQLARIARSLPDGPKGFVACDFDASTEAWRAALEGCAGVFLRLLRTVTGRAPGFWRT